MNFLYSNLCFLFKKVASHLLFILLLFSSCQNTPSLHQRHEDLKGFDFGDKKNIDKAEKFYANINWKLVDKVETFCQKNFYQQSEEVLNATAVTDVFLFCLVPGFQVRNIDPYSIKVGKVCNKIILSQPQDSIVCMTRIFSRWGSFLDGSIDNESFETQYWLLAYQLNLQLKAIKSCYKNPDLKIHVTFIGESFGGKIVLFFLDQYLTNNASENVFFERFITIHSPLYPLQFVTSLKNSRFVQSLGQIPFLTDLFSRLDFLFNPEAYDKTFSLLESEEVNYISTDKALDVLRDRGMKFLHFVGTPDRIKLGDATMSWKECVCEIYAALKTVNLIRSVWDLTTNLFGLRMPPMTQDSFLALFEDTEYLFNSDFLVKTSEITRDPNIVRKILTYRQAARILQNAKGDFFFSSPNLLHLGENFLIWQFGQDLKDLQRNRRFLEEFFSI